jgi:hypothetical protein
LLADGQIREHLIAAGRKRAQESLAVDYAKNLGRVVDLYAERRRRYAWPA